MLCCTSALQAQAGHGSILSCTRIDRAINAVSVVMIHDVVSPPAASRYYTYCMLGAYNLVALKTPGSIPAAGFIPACKGQTNSPLVSKRYNYQFAAIYCILETGRLMLPSGYLLDADEKAYLGLLQKNNIPQAVIAASVIAAQEMAIRITGFAGKDNYRRLSARLRYTPLKGDEYWYPTPPVYMEAVEPNWKIIRPMFVDSASQFKPATPIPFSKDSGSVFFHQAMDVYHKGNKLSSSELNIASFWDCNPFAVSVSGHMMIGFKKISPGGHWMNIAGIAVRQAHLDFSSSVTVLTAVAAALMDAFICTWDEKYRTNKIRPETYINRYIDSRWTPLLQTPPFPEYPSGHAVISNAAAEVLDFFLGGRFSYTDNSEVPYGIGPRRFDSFRSAAEEAGISRYYGGIHFMDAVENGNLQGRHIGEFIVTLLKKEGFSRYEGIK